MTDSSAQPLPFTTREKPDAGPVPEETPNLAQVLGRLSAQLDPARRGAGDMAELRRLDHSPYSPAFWRLYFEFIPRTWREPKGRPDRRVDHAWAVLIRAMAEMAPRPSRSGAGFGAALAGTGYSESRFLRLLRARENNLAREIRVAARWLAVHGRPADWYLPAQCVLGQLAFGLPVNRQTAVHRLASDYFREQART